MDNAERMKLLRQNNALSEENDKLKQMLSEARTALVHAQATAQALSEICTAMTDKAKDGALNDAALAQVDDQIATVKDTEWLVELHDEALERGFNAGYLFARTRGKSLGDKESAMDAFRGKASSLWPTAKRGPSRYLNASLHEEPSRYRLDPEDPDNPFDYDDCGEYTDYHAYASLKLRYDVLKEELAGYRWLLNDPLRTPVDKNCLADGCHQFVRRPQKPGILKAQFGRCKGEQDFFVLYGDGVPACDRSLVFYAFGSSRMSYDYTNNKQTFEPSLLEELKSRGYDLSTLRFSVCKKENA